MDTDEKLFNDLIYSDSYKSLQSFLDGIDVLITDEIGVERKDTLPDDIFDMGFLKEIMNFRQTDVSLYFGKTPKDLKCIISDENSIEHVLWIQYIGPKNLRIRDMTLPRSPLQDQIYRSIDEAIFSFKQHIRDLSNYFDELSRIDVCCTIMEPVRPTFKEDYRKILLADKIWLHVEVSPEGSAKNLSVLGQFDQYELQGLLQAWDHDKDIAANVLTITSALDCRMRPEAQKTVAVPACGICYCDELPGDPSVPQPLCSNSNCGVYFHRNCLYEWLVTCAKGLKPQFGVGKCPSCSQYIQCSDRDIRQ